MWTILALAVTAFASDEEAAAESVGEQAEDQATSVDDAPEELASAETQPPEHPERRARILAEAARYRDEMNFQAAMNNLRSLPQDRQVRLETAITYWKANRMDAAIVLLQDTVTLDVQDAYATELLARLYIWDGRVRPAQRLLAKWLWKHPQDDRAWTLLGDAYKDDFQRSLSVEAYERAIALRPDRSAAAQGLRAWDEIDASWLNVEMTGIALWGDKVYFEGWGEYYRRQRLKFGWSVGARVGNDPILGGQLRLPIEGRYRVWSGLSWFPNHNLGLTFTPSITVGNGVWAGTRVGLGADLGPLAILAEAQPGYSASTGVDMKLNLRTDIPIARSGVRVQGVGYYDPGRYWHSMGILGTWFDLDKVLIQAHFGGGKDSLGPLYEARLSVDVPFLDGHALGLQVLHTDGRLRNTRFTTRYAWRF